MPEIAYYRIITKGRVALEPILFTSNFLAIQKLAKIWQVPNFGSGDIGPCFNENFAD